MSSPLRALSPRSWTASSCRRRGLKEFVQVAWPQVEASGLIWNWHLDAMVEHLEAVTRREIRDLAINVPPGLSKSRVVSILWPAWMWTLDPGRRFLVASFSADVVYRDARKMREPCAHRGSKRGGRGWCSSRTTAAPATRWAYSRTPRVASARATRSRASGPESMATTLWWTTPLTPRRHVGRGADAVIEWYTGTMPTRFRDHARSTRTLIMQRIHAKDLTPEFVRAGATVFCLPMRFNPSHPHRWPRDPRTVKESSSALSASPRRSAAHREAAGADARRRTARPALVPPGGGVPAGVVPVLDRAPREDVRLGALRRLHFQEHQRQRFRRDPGVVHPGPNHYLVDQRRERMGFNATVKAIRAMCEKYPRVVRKLIEDKANGSAVIETLKHELGVLPVEPDGGKEARANAVQPLVAAGNVFVPHPTRARYSDGRVGAPWVGMRATTAPSLWTPRRRFSTRSRPSEGGTRRPGGRDDAVPELRKRVVRRAG